jgi:hypothetical protein
MVAAENVDYISLHRPSVVNMVLLRSGSGSCSWAQGRELCILGQSRVCMLLHVLRYSFQACSPVFIADLFVQVLIDNSGNATVHVEHPRRVGCSMQGQ